MVIAKVIAKQHLQHMTLFEGIFRKTTEIERERERERTGWMPNDMVQ